LALENFVVMHPPTGSWDSKTYTLL
jgi:hypothetical protein